ncbi:MAG: hypothetical protein M3072_17495 [Candidatus Dormibacteraeota bacterium]|nr:hypothetical protein [Candidatus Dormibacteraeota bacterium]
MPKEPARVAQPLNWAVDQAEPAAPPSTHRPEPPVDIVYNFQVKLDMTHSVYTLQMLAMRCGRFDTHVKCIEADEFPPGRRPAGAPAEERWSRRRIARPASHSTPAPCRRTSTSTSRPPGRTSMAAHRGAASALACPQVKGDPAVHARLIPLPNVHASRADARLPDAGRAPNIA